jgi:hypothetical protein
VKAQIVANLTSQKSLALLKAKALEVKQKLVGGEEVETVAKQFGSEWHVAIDARRDDARVDNFVLQQSFKLARPVGGEAVFSIQETSAGNVVLIQLNDVKAADLASVSAAEKKRVESRLASEVASVEYSAFQSQLKVEAKLQD